MADEFSYEDAQTPIAGETKGEVSYDEVMGAGQTMEAPKESTYTFSDSGLRSFGLRTKLGFANGPSEKLDILNANGVKAAIIGDEIHYLDPNTNEISKIDERGFSVYDIADIIGDVPEAVGMGLGGAIGAIAGARSGNPNDVWKGGAAGSAIGGALGTKVKTAFARDFGAVIPDEEESKRLIESGLTGLAADPAGRVISNVFHKTLAPFAGKLVEGFKQTNEVLGKFKDARGRPLYVTPAQGTNSRGLQIAEGVAGSSFIGGGTLNTLKAEQEQVLEQAVDGLARNVSRGSYTPEQYGLLVRDAVAKKGQTFRAVENKLWGEVDRLMPDKVAVDMGGVRQWAQEQLAKTAQARQLAPSVSGKKGVGVVDVLSDMASLPDRVSFSTAHEWISNLSAKTRMGPDQVLNSKEIGVLKDLNRQLNGTIEQTGIRLSKEAQASGTKGQNIVEAFNTARNFTRDWRTTFDDKLVNSLVNAEPQKVAGALFKPNQIEGVREARKAMGNGTFQKLKGAFVANLFTPEGKTELQGAAITKRWAKFDDATKREILNNPGELRDVDAMVKAIETTQRVKPGGQGSVAIQLTQPGAMLQLAGAVGATSTPFPKTSAAVIILPGMMAKLLASPGGAKWLTEGFKAPVGTEQASKATSIVMSMVMRNSKGDNTKDFKILSADEAGALIKDTENLRKVQSHVQKRKEGIPLTFQEEQELDTVAPGSSRLNTKDMFPNQQQ